MTTTFATSSLPIGQKVYVEGMFSEYYSSYSYDSPLHWVVGNMTVCQSITSNTDYCHNYYDHYHYYYHYYYYYYYHLP